MLTIRKPATLVISCWMLAQLSPRVAAFGHRPDSDPSTPTDVVRQYCEFDLNIGRISSSNFAKLPNLTTWEEEPGWDTVVVVSGFKILSASQSGKRAAVTVKWRRLGTAEGENVVRDRRPEIVRYNLKLVGGNWRIDSPVIPPHVSVPTLHAFVVANFQNEPKRQKIWIQRLDALLSNTN